MQEHISHTIMILYCRLRWAIGGRLSSEDSHPLLLNVVSKVIHYDDEFICLLHQNLPVSLFMSRGSKYFLLSFDHFCMFIKRFACQKHVALSTKWLRRTDNCKLILQVCNQNVLVKPVLRDCSGGPKNRCLIRQVVSCHRWITMRIALMEPRKGGLLTQVIFQRR